MTDYHFNIFDTPLGPCGIAWSARGIAGTQLPEADAAATRARLRRRFRRAAEVSPPAAVEAACTAITALLRGERRDLAEIALDMDGVPGEHREVYAIARRIPPGATSTYGEIAAELGDRLLAQAVGQALGKNPFAIIVPCHRVLAAGGKAGGFSAAGGLMLKRRLLAIESVHDRSGPTLFDRT